MAKNPKNMKVEVSTDGVTWVDISGKANSVSPDGGDWDTADHYVFGTDTAEVLLGKRAPVDVTVRSVYEETSGTGYQMVKTAYESGATFYLRWSPFGGTTGDKRYVATGPVTHMDWPGGEANSADPILAEWTIRAATITTEDVV